MFAVMSDAAPLAFAGARQRWKGGKLVPMPGDIGQRDVVLLIHSDCSYLAALYLKLIRHLSSYIGLRRRIPAPKEHNVCSNAARLPSPLRRSAMFHAGSTQSKTYSSLNSISNFRNSAKYSSLKLRFAWWAG